MPQLVTGGFIFFIYEEETKEAKLVNFTEIITTHLKNIQSHPLPSLLDTILFNKLSYGTWSIYVKVCHDPNGHPSN